MKLKGKVLKDFNDSKNNFKKYYAQTEYTEADIFEADEERYIEVFKKSFVEAGVPVKKNFKIEKEED